MTDPESSAPIPPTKTPGLRPAQKGTQPPKQDFLSRVQNHSLIWYHSKDTRKRGRNVLTIYWACPACRKTQSPAINSGIQQAEKGRDGWEDVPVPEDRNEPGDYYLSAFVCRFCNTKWDVTIERVDHE